MTRSQAIRAWEALFRAQVAVMRSLTAEFSSKDISLNEYDVLFNLSRQPSHQLRLRDLNKQLLLTQPSVSRLIDRLVARGYVWKTHDPADRRGALVGLTEDGYELFRRTAVGHAASIAAHVGGALDERELNELAALCNKLRQANT